MRAVQSSVVMGVGAWGLISFVVYLWHNFDEPLAFAKAQICWGMRVDGSTRPLPALIGTLTLEPIWSVYCPANAAYWARFETHSNPFMSLQFANPMLFLLTAVLVVVGWRKRWLNDYELLLSGGLLLVPYFTKSYDNAMASFGRFSVVVLPAYIVMGQLLVRLPRTLAAAVLSLSAFYLAVYSALFSAGYRFP